MSDGTKPASINSVLDSIRSVLKFKDKGAEKASETINAAVSGAASVAPPSVETKGGEDVSQAKPQGRIMRAGEVSGDGKETIVSAGGGFTEVTAAGRPKEAPKKPISYTPPIPQTNLVALAAKVPAPRSAPLPDAPSRSR